MNTQDHTPEKAYAVRVIEALGGTAEVARLCKIDMAAVSQWKKKGIPSYRVDFLKLARPDAFQGLDNPGEAQAPPLHQ